MILTTVILIISFFNIVYLESDVNTEVYQRDCKLIFTYGYGYNKFFHISEFGGQKGKNFTIRFLVRARSDAHLLLSTVPSPPENLPVYEIVLGAGKNTFSDIRRLRRSATRATAATKDLLSHIELRGFWVHFNNKGLIQIGKEGDDIPFLFWNDPSPLDIKYFSFCTWTGVVGKWLYDCPIANDTEKIEVVEEKPRTMTEKLRKDLLTNYDPYAPPLIDLDHRIAVFIALLYHHVTLDVKQSKIIIDGQLTMHWVDEKIQWKPEDYGGLKDIHVNEHEVWIPEIILYNAVGHGADILKHTGMMINSQGEVMWSPSTHLEAWCNLDVNQWPSDEHTCELQLGFWIQRDVLELLIFDNVTMIGTEKKAGTEWEIVKTEAEPLITSTPWIQDFDFDDFNIAADSLIVRITLKRQSHPYNTILVAPLIVISILMMLSFWMSPENSGKMATVCVSIVLLALFITMMGNILPAPTDHVPCLVLLYSWSMVAGVLIILTSTLVIYLTRYTHKNPPPSLLSLIITHPITQNIMLLPKATTEPGKSYNPLEETTEVNESCPEISTRIVSPNLQEIQQYWIVWPLLLIALHSLHIQYS
ncbi:hypothetical protein L9F63_009891 [Diploptera punctata]|uniref:Uncharacterized protein n=1 Tax=Diploptera punctata TaxID=6984 RepID=A0AAD8AJL9_DIPPU|nr:hypothetical protein L9F63_009891 [Diploptera punctata]